MVTDLEELYVTDFFSWTQQQAAILRLAGAQRLNAPPGADWERLAEEIEELGRAQLREINSRYIVLIAHLLKWLCQPAGRGPSWRGTIREQRRKIAQLLRKSPGTKPVRHAEFEDAYADALELAVDETLLDIRTFPAACPFSLEQVEDKDFWPETLDTRQLDLQSQAEK